MAQAGQPRGQRDELGRRIGLVGRRSAQHGARPRMAQQRLGFGRPVRHVQGRDHAAEHRHRIIGDHEIRRARQLDGDDVAAPQAERGQRRRQPFGLLERGPVGDRRVTGGGDRDRARRLARPAPQPGRDGVGGPAAAVDLAPDLLGPEGQRVADRQRIGPELRIVISVVIHAALRPKPPATPELEQPIIVFRLEPALLEQDPNEGHLLGRQPEPCRDLAVAPAGAVALRLDCVELQQPDRVAAAILHIGAEIEDDRAERRDHLRRDAEPLTPGRHRPSWLLRRFALPRRA